jgi:hypothetical protein
MEDDLKKKWKTNQSIKINIIGCDTNVNSSSYYYLLNMLAAFGQVHVFFQPNLYFIQESIIINM